MKEVFWSNKAMYLLASLAILVFLGCSTSRMATKSADLVPARSFEKSFNSSFLQPKYLKAKARVKYRDEDQGLTFTMHLRMIKDEAIWLSGTFLGFEVARVLITPDSLKAINKYEKSYTLKSIHDLRSEYDIDKLDFGLIQNLFLGNDLMPKNEIEAFETDSLNYIIKKRETPFVQTMEINPAFEMIKLALHRENELLVAQVEQDRFKPLSNQNISYFRKYIINNANANSASIQLDFNDIVEEKPRGIPFRIPDNYDFVD